MSAAEPQCASRVLLVRPAAFAYDEATAATNAFQQRLSGVAPAELAARARGEIEALAGRLESAGVAVVMLEDDPEPPRPDAAFPNNWFSTHADGTLVLYPMRAASRRREVRRDALEAVAARHGLRIERVVDLTGLAERGEFLEGTGSLVLDRPRRLAFACRSPRTTEAAAHEWAGHLGYELAFFDATDAAGRAIYHTNVCLAVGARFAVACLEALSDAEQRSRLAERLRAGGRELIDIDRGQMAEFCGNVLELRGAGGEGLLALSERARRGFRRDQIDSIERHVELVAAPIETIETCGGGSVRCTLAELFLPDR